MDGNRQNGRQTNSPDKAVKKRKSRRARAREFALQALYQYFLGGGDAAAVDGHTRGLVGFHKADGVFFDALFHGSLAASGEIEGYVVSVLDRPIAEVSPIERACLWLGVYEFVHCLDVPYRVVINEYVELAKDFGGTDGFRYVNGVLHKLSSSLRPHEAVKQ